MTVVTDAKDYEVIDIVTVDVLNPMMLKEQIQNLLKGKTVGNKQYVQSLFEETNKEIKEKLDAKQKEMELDALYDVKITPFIKDVKSETFIGATAQALGLKKKKWGKDEKDRKFNGNIFHRNTKDIC